VWAHARALFRAIAAGIQFDLAPATEVGIERARDGVPLASVMEAYRIGFREVWEAIVAESASRTRLNGEALRILTEKTLAAQDAVRRRSRACGGFPSYDGRAAGRRDYRTPSP
jgi:hypothetical protein